MKSLIFVLMLSLPQLASAALYDRGNGLIYDDVLNITWLQDANYAQTSGFDDDGKMNWVVANLWAAQLSYDGHDDWRLASANLMNPNNPCNADDGSCDIGYNNTTGELGYMYYTNLSNQSHVDTNCHPNCLTNTSFVDGGSGDTVSFLNVQSDVYWYAEEYGPSTSSAWGFNTSNGIQNSNGKSFIFYAWAVSDGDIAAPTLVTIDIKPNRKTTANTINLKREKNLKVAILTEGTFDALQVDPATVKFGPNEATTHRYQVKDFDRDGDPDLILIFKTKNTGIACSDTSATLTGETFSGDAIEGSDSFATTGC